MPGSPTVRRASRWRFARRGRRSAPRTSAGTCWPGLTSCARSVGCRHCRRESSPARGGVDEDGGVTVKDGDAVSDHEPAETGEPAQAAETVDSPPPLPVLHTPEDGIPHVVTDEHELDEVASAIAQGEGPVAIDAERASGYRYGQRAYLVQLKRDGSGLWLIDPTALPDLTPVNDAIGD